MIKLIKHLHTRKTRIKLKRVYSFRAQPALRIWPRSAALYPVQIPFVSAEQHFKEIRVFEVNCEEHINLGGPSTG